MPLSLNFSMVNNMVNTLTNAYNPNARTMSATQAQGGFKTTQGVKNKFQDSFVSSAELKNTLNDPSSSVALSLRDKTHPDAANELAQEVADGLERASGRRDGLIAVTDDNGWGSVFGSKALVSKYELADALASGSVVIGEGGQVMPRETAKAHGDTIVAIHENAKGPTIALDQ